MPRAMIPTIPVQVHLRLINTQQTGSGKVIVGGVPVFSSDLHNVQHGEGFWGDIWHGITSGFKTIGETLFKTGSDIIGDIINPGVNIKKTVIKRAGEASSHLLDQAAESIRRRTGTKRSSTAAAEAAAAANLPEAREVTQSGGKRQRRLPSVKKNMKSLQYITCPSSKKRSVRKRRRRRVQKKGKTHRRIKRRQSKKRLILISTRGHKRRRKGTKKIQQRRRRRRRRRQQIGGDLTNLGF
jgi:hypothetical protein